MPQRGNPPAYRRPAVQQTVENRNDAKTTCSYAACPGRTSALRFCGSPVCRADNDRAHTWSANILLAQREFPAV